LGWVLGIKLSFFLCPSLNFWNSKFRVLFLILNLNYLQCFLFVIGKFSIFCIESLCHQLWWIIF
jgi:hypothetical protein